MVGLSRHRREIPDSEQVPNPERIHELAAEIRNGWTPRERHRRSGGFVQRVELLELSIEPHRRGLWPDLI